MAKIPLSAPRFHDRRQTMVGLQWDGEKLQSYRGMRQEIEPVLKAVQEERELLERATHKPLYRPLVKIPEVHVMNWLKGRGKTMRDLFRDADLKQEYRKWAMSSENKKLRVS